MALRPRLVAACSAGAILLGTLLLNTCNSSHHNQNPVALDSYGTFLLDLAQHSPCTNAAAKSDASVQLACNIVFNSHNPQGTSYPRPLSYDDASRLVDALTAYEHLAGNDAEAATQGTARAHLDAVCWALGGDVCMTLLLR